MWDVRIHSRVSKSLPDLPPTVRELFEQLLKELRAKGPVAREWPHYGKIKGQKNPAIHHCHLKRGRPTYVSMWWEVKTEGQTIEVTYVGTHEKAPY
jgi:mRNA-degrading endonuclease RelE of RelBE toxin-antitoxin system